MVRPLTEAPEPTGATATPDWKKLKSEYENKTGKHYLLFAGGKAQ